MAEEGNLNFMLMMAKNLLDREKIESLDEIFEQIDLIDSAHIQSLATEMLNPDTLELLDFRTLIRCIFTSIYPFVDKPVIIATSIFRPIQAEKKKWFRRFVAK